MGRKKYNDEYSYEIFDDGYDIYKYDVVVIVQRDPFGKVYDADGTYEENALLQLEDITKPTPYIPTDEELLRSDVDYMAVMLDVDLPSYDMEV